MKSSKIHFIIILIAIFSFMVVMLVLGSSKKEEIIEKQTSFPPTSSWLKGKDKWSGIEFMYPSSIGTIYMTPGLWPPTISRIEDHDECGPGDFIDKTMKFSLKPINFGGQTYCFLSGTDAAGRTINGKKHVYYVISKPTTNKRISFSINLYYSECGDLPEPKQVACQREQANFNITELAHNVLSTVSEK